MDNQGTNKPQDKSDCTRPLDTTGGAATNPSDGEVPTPLEKWPSYDLGDDHQPSNDQPIDHNYHHDSIQPRDPAEVKRRIQEDAICLATGETPKSPALTPNKSTRLYCWWMVFCCISFILAAQHLTQLAQHLSLTYAPVSGAAIAATSAAKTDPLMDYFGNHKAVVTDPAACPEQSITVTGDCAIKLDGRSVLYLDSSQWDILCDVSVVRVHNRAEISLRGTMECVFNEGYHEFLVNGAGVTVEGKGRLRVDRNGFIEVGPLTADGHWERYCGMRVTSMDARHLTITGARFVVLGGQARGNIRKCGEVILSGNAIGEQLENCETVTCIGQARAFLKECLDAQVADSTAILAQKCRYLTLSGNSQAWLQDCLEADVSGNASIHAVSCSLIRSSNAARGEYLGEGTIVSPPGSLAKVSTFRWPNSLDDMEQQLDQQSQYPTNRPVTGLYRDVTSTRYNATAPHAVPDPYSSDQNPDQSVVPTVTPPLPVVTANRPDVRSARGGCDIIDPRSVRGDADIIDPYSATGPVTFYYYDDRSSTANAESFVEFMEAFDDRPTTPAPGAGMWGDDRLWMYHARHQDKYPTHSKYDPYQCVPAPSTTTDSNRPRPAQEPPVSPGAYEPFEKPPVSNSAMPNVFAPPPVLPPSPNNQEVDPRLQPKWAGSICTDGDTYNQTVDPRFQPSYPQGGPPSVPPINHRRHHDHLGCPER